MHRHLLPHTDGRCLAAAHRMPAIASWSPLTGDDDPCTMSSRSRTVLVCPQIVYTDVNGVFCHAAGSSPLGLSLRSRDPESACPAPWPHAQDRNIRGGTRSCRLQHAGTAHNPGDRDAR
jgi:hypothetical protein